MAAPGRGAGRIRLPGKFTPLDHELATRDAEPRGGLLVVNIDTGVTEEWLRFLPTLDERYGGDAIKMIVRPEQAAAGGVIRQGADDVTPVLIQPGKSQWKTLTSGDSVYGEQSSGQVTGHEEPCRLPDSTAVAASWAGSEESRSDSSFSVVASGPVVEAARVDPGLVAEDLSVFR